MTIPAVSYWGFWSQLLSGSTIALLVWWLARGRIRTERWHEQQQELYHRLVEDLYVIQEYTGPKAEDEDRAEGGDLPPLATEAMYASMLPAVEQAQREVLKYAAVGPFLLTTPAVAILQRYRRDLNDPDATGTHRPMGAWHWLARECWIEFSERARYDLGQISGPRFHWRRGKRRASVARYLIKSRVSGWKFLAGSRIEEWRLTFGPQLSQNDVRTPPKFRHFKTVAQMQKIGFRPGRIQRELRLQRKADPPPWK